MLADLLGRPPSGKSEAELWVGAHPDAPATVVGDGRTLDSYIADDPLATLGPAVIDRFGPRLPFLLKVLAVERPLSIQAHPTIAQAVEGYAAEDAADIALDSSQRSYHDRNHKPEMVVALTEFETLVGFTDPAVTADILESCEHPELVGAGAVLRGDNGLRNLIRRWLTLPAEQAQIILSALTQEAAARATDPLFALIGRLHQAFPDDRGLLVAILMRYTRLHNGQAVFVQPGVPHAYLSGFAVEAQANSDNTLRAGLTIKHVNTDEVMRVLRYEVGGGTLIQPHRRDGELVYAAPGVDDFLLTKVALSAADVPISGPLLMLVVDGEATVSTASGELTLHRGQAAFVLAADASARVRGKGVAFTLATALGGHDKRLLDR